MSRFAPPSADDQFWARAFAVMTRPSKAVRTFSMICNGLFYLTLSAFLGFIGQQIWDRSQPPVSYVGNWADPRGVSPGGAVKVWTKLVRHKRCRYAVSWSVTDSRSMVSYFGPVFQDAPGEASPDVQPPFGLEYQTPSIMASGLATLRITLRGNCPGNYLDDWWPVVIEVPPVTFDVSDQPHDLSPGAHP